MEEFLICENASCRFVVSLRKGTSVYRRSELPLSSCPVCSQKWSGRCPFCDQTLEVIWRSNVPCRSHFDREFRPDERVDSAAP